MASNFPNMSYCAFENTSKAMDQCADMLQEALDSNEPLELNRYERSHFDRMYEQCRALMELLERHQEMVEEQEDEEDPDGEPSGPDDLSDDAEVLASAGMGTDEDYGYTGDDC